MKKYSLFMVGMALFLGLFGGYYLGNYFRTDEPSRQTKIAKKPLYWIDSMEPIIHYPQPGMSRMGMQLIPVYPDDTQGETLSTVRISPAVVNNLGVRTAIVSKGLFSRRIKTIGYVEPNENNISHIHAYANGWVKNLVVKAIGDVVKKGQIVLQLYSPTLVNAEEEYLIALESKNEALIEAAEQKLQTFHIAEQQIELLRATHKASHLIDIYPHRSGVVTMLNVREGMYVLPETEMMSIVDLSTVWMIAQIFEDQANWIKTGDLAEAHLTAFPEKKWIGKVDYIYPEVDSKTRTIKVRLCFNNPEGMLKPNMYANIMLLANPKQQVLSIPLEALIRSNEGNRVIIALGQGRFQSRLITTGIESGERIEILSGLSAGEKVVISAQFLLDSEINLKAGMERLQTPTQNAETKDGL